MPSPSQRPSRGSLPPRARGRLRLAGRIAARLAVAAALGAAFTAVQVPAHEYAHCVLWWARGSDAPCAVTFAPPGGGVGDHTGAPAGLVGLAAVEGLPWWEHPLLYALHGVGALAASVVLGRFLARATAPDAPAAQPAAPGERGAPGGERPTGA